ncbi:Bug family tripartite tricarboxylate transporter substrate binding protein [Mesobacillus harenae]|uniref:Bug family tripartite tricarboxylate transporter substrate binding protein n=1 Tax=Mesobacillus harenae TaxID=2213203 RepID=UPI00158067A2|nr:tripartite tricarboxylate transporter substrate binding protein [Mesobacillus harenae]
MKKLVMKKLAIIGFAAMLAAGCSNGAEESGSSASSADYPERDIDIIVPYAPGGTTDTASRALSSVISEYLPNGYNANVVNKEGGAGVIGTTEVFNAKPDGYKIGMTTVGPMTIKPHTDNTAYTPETIEPIMQVVATPNVLVVQNDAPWQTYEEWYEYAESNPGEFSYGTSGAGLTQHISMEAFSTQTGVELKHVPFEGGAPALAALLGGHVQGALVQTTEAMPHIESGNMRALVNTGSFKTEGLEDVPLLSEKGVDVASDVWTGLIAPQGTPQEIIDVLHDSFKKALEDPKVVETFEKLGVNPAYAGPDEFAEIMQKDYDLNEEVLKAAGIIQ